MIWLWTLVLIVVLFFSYLLFAPFYLEINSNNGMCRVRFHRLASVGIVIKDNSLVIDVSIAGWKRQFDLVDMLTTKREKKKVIRTRKKKPIKISVEKIKAIVKSFKVSKCYVSVDSGNVQLNGMLFPVFYWLGRRAGKTIEINFLDKNIIILEINNNFARIIRAFIFH